MYTINFYQKYLDLKNKLSACAFIYDPSVLKLIAISGMSNTPKTYILVVKTRGNLFASVFNKQGIKNYYYDKGSNPFNINVALEFI